MFFKYNFTFISLIELKFDCFNAIQNKKILMEFHIKIFNSISNNRFLISFQISCFKFSFIIYILMQFKLVFFIQFQTNFF